MKNNTRKNILALDGKAILNLANKIKTRPAKNEDPISKFIHETLLPIAREVVFKFKIEGAELRTGKNGEFTYVEKGTTADMIVKKLVYVRPYVESDDKKIIGFNRKPNELLWVFRFALDDNLSQFNWEDIPTEELGKFLFDPVTGLDTKTYGGIRPIVPKNVANLFTSNGIYLNTIPLIKYYVDCIIHSVNSYELVMYIDYLSGVSSETKKSEDTDEEDQESMEEVPNPETPMQLDKYGCPVNAGQGEDLTKF